MTQKFQALTVDEFATFNNVHRDTVIRGIQSGKIPAYKIGRQWRIPANYLEQLQSYPGGAT